MRKYTVKTAHKTLALACVAFICMPHMQAMQSCKDLIPNYAALKFNTIKAATIAALLLTMYTQYPSDIQSLYAYHLLTQ